MESRCERFLEISSSNSQEVSPGVPFQGVTNQAASGSLLLQSGLLWNEIDRNPEAGSYSARFCRLRFD
jgi:hypothetical protein